MTGVFGESAVLMGAGLITAGMATILLTLAARVASELLREATQQNSAGP